MICVFARFRVFYYVPCFATHAVRLSHAVFASASFTSPRRSECVCRHSCRRFPRLYSSFLVSGSFLFRSVLCLRLLETSSPFVISKPRNFIHISLYIFSLHYFCLSSFEWHFTCCVWYIVIAQPLRCVSGGVQGFSIVCIGAALISREPRRAGF